MRLNQKLVLQSNNYIKDKTGGYAPFAIQNSYIFASILNKKVSVQGSEIEGKPITQAGLEITIRAENLNKLLNAEKVLYKNTQIYFDNLPKFTPKETKYIKLNAKFQSTIQYK